MATVPGVLLLSGYHGQGGAVQVYPGYPFFGVDDMADPMFDTYVPGGIAEQPLPDFFPWYDGSASNVTYAINSATTTTITVSPSPGWTVNQWAGRICTVLELYFGVPGLPLMPKSATVIVSNTANVLTLSTPLAVAPTGLWFRIGTGRLVGYHCKGSNYGLLGAAAGDKFEVTPGVFSTISQSLGSGWAQGGVGLGPDTGLVPALWRKRYPTAPWFHLWKQIGVVGVTGYYDDGGSQRAGFTAELARVVAAAAERGNTIDWKLAIIDLCEADIRASVTAANYKDALAETIAWLKTTLGNQSMHFQIVSHDPLAHSVNRPGFTLAYRAKHREIAREVQRVAILDMAGNPMSRFQHGGEAALDYQYYGRSTYTRYGERAVDLFGLQLASVTPASPQQGLPVYVLFGDDFAVGNIPEAWTTLLASGSLLGDVPTFVRGPGQRVWNDVSHSLEPYDATSNENTAGTIVDKAGPGISITDELAKLHPVTGFVLIKLASVTSALATQVAVYSGGGAAGGRWMRSLASEHWTSLVDMVHEVQGAMVDAGFIPDMRGVFVCLGYQDTTVVGGGAAFAAELANIVPDIREAFTSRTSGAALPIAWTLPVTGAYGSRPPELEQVRAALTARASGDAKFRTVNLDDLERDRADLWHDTPDTTVERGRRMVAALAEIAI